MPRTRRPTHAGSWYENNGEALATEIRGWMDAVEPQPGVHAQAVIAPHAGYSYSGHVMAYAYKHIDASRVSRIFLLGPSHKLYTKDCLLTGASSYSTPLGPIDIDQEVYKQLEDTGAFGRMGMSVDEAEHSLELHTPFIVAAMGGRPFKLVPIMVGALSTSREAEYGALLAPYLADPSNCFVISSDFCHWGSRFSYTFYDKSQGPIWKSIEWLDHQGIAAIEAGSSEQFASYLATYKNTICGRHPIGVLLNMLESSELGFKVKFQHYAQSSACKAPSDSSVSYASAIVMRA